MTTRLGANSHKSVFDTSLQYHSYSQQLQITLTLKASKLVQTWNLDEPSWKLSKNARDLADKIFKEYCDNLRSTFRDANYIDWLELSIAHDKMHFLPSLLSKILAFLPENI